MTIRDAYLNIIEKRANSEENVLHESVPENNSAQSIDYEHNRNREDHRSYLHSVFSNAESVQNNQSTELKKLFPNMPRNTSTSNPLIKVALRNVFLESVSNQDFSKTASPIHLEVAFNAFVDEIEKIVQN